MAFRKKAHHILAHQPDILIVQECEHTDKLIFNNGTQQPTDMLWFGTNQNKGLGIFSYSDYRFRVMENHKPEFKMVVPILATGSQYNFTLYAVWANNPADPDGHYIEQVWKAIHHYEADISNQRTMLVGDFNSNTIWDRKRRAANHSNVVRFLEDKGIYSTYHLHHQQVQGKEQHPTLYMYRHKDKPYHLDYCFVSKDMLDKLLVVEIGDYGAWSGHSDHMPLMATFND